MGKRAQIWILGFVGLVLVQAALSLSLRAGFGLTVFSDVVQCLALLCGVLFFAPISYKSHGRARIFWAFMALGLVFWLAYQIIWTHYEVVLRLDVPDPFVGDVVLFLHLVPMMAALALQPHAEQDQWSTKLGALDFALLLTWWLYLYLFAVIPWQYVYTDAPQYDHNFNLIYLAEKIFFLAGLAVLWRRSSGYWRLIYAHLLGAGAVYALSSYIANWAIARKTYYSGSLFDVPLLVSMAWMGATGALAGSLPLKQKARTNGETHGVWVTRLGMIALCTLPLFAAVCAFDNHLPSSVRTFRLVATLSTMLVMGVMVFFKQHLLDRELLGLLRTSQESFENLKRLQTQLVQSEKLASLGQLVGGAAHELNNPLAAMLGYADLLASTSLDEEQRSLAEKIGQQVRRTRTLVSDLLSFAKQVPTEKTPVDLNTLVQTAVKLSRPQLTARNINVDSDLDANLPPVLGDSNQLLQVCLHIVNNALHAMAESGGSLRITTQPDGNRVTVEFADNGPGTPEPDRVFDPFYTTRPVGGGAGLGLSACYGIIQEHKGRIMCHNRPEGGLSVHIELPAVVQVKTNGRQQRSPEEDEERASAALTLPPTP